MKQIPNLDYSISPNGKTFYWNEDLKPRNTFTNAYGYLVASLRPVYTNEGKKKIPKVAIHKLVALAYLPNPDNLPQINHIDGNKLNNHYSNLEWCTAKANIRHAYDTGLMNNTKEASRLRGLKKDKSFFSDIRKASRKFTNEQIVHIRTFDNNVKTRTIVSEKYNVKPDTIYRIMTRKSYSDVP